MVSGIEFLLIIPICHLPCAWLYDAILPTSSKQQRKKVAAEAYLSLRIESHY